MAHQSKFVIPAPAICPRCTGPVYAQARSRITKDRAIIICGRCGGDEVAEELDLGVLTPQAEWPVAAELIAARAAKCVDRLLLPDPIPLPPQAQPPFIDAPGGFSPEDGTRTVVGYIGQAEVWSAQIANGELVQAPFVALNSETCETGWSPSRARAIAADVLRAADLAEQWENWSPASAQLEEPDQR